MWLIMMKAICKDYYKLSKFPYYLSLFYYSLHGSYDRKLLVAEFLEFNTPSLFRLLSEENDFHLLKTLRDNKNTPHYILVIINNKISSILDKAFEPLN